MRCGLLYCKTTDSHPIHGFEEKFSCTKDGQDVCWTAVYNSFYNGPNRPSPDLVPNGAKCGEYMVRHDSILQGLAPKIIFGDSREPPRNTFLPLGLLFKQMSLVGHK